MSLVDIQAHSNFSSLKYHFNVSKSYVPRKIVLIMVVVNIFNSLKHNFQSSNSIKMKFISLLAS